MINQKPLKVTLSVVNSRRRNTMTYFAYFLILLGLRVWLDIWATCPPFEDTSNDPYDWRRGWMGY